MIRYGIAEGIKDAIGGRTYVPTGNTLLGLAVWVVEPSLEEQAIQTKPKLP